MFKLNDIVIVNGKYDGLEVKNQKGKIINVNKDNSYCTVNFFTPNVGRHAGMYFSSINPNITGIVGEKNCYCYPLQFEGFQLANKQLELFGEENV